MSKSFLLDQIARLERLADAFDRAPESHWNSLAGQALGTASTIKSEFEGYGINASNDYLGDLCGNMRNKNDYVQAMHALAAHFRALTSKI